VFFSGTGLGTFVTFLALPIYTRLIPPADFGYFDLSQTYVTIIAALVYADVWVGVMRFSLSDATESAKAIRAGLQFLLLSSFVMLLLAIGIWTALDPDHLWLALGLGLARSLASFWSDSSRGLGGEKAFAASGVLNAVVSFGVTVTLLAIAEIGVAGLYVGVIVGCLAQVVFLEARFRLLDRACCVVTDRALRARLGWFALPLSLNSVAFWVFTGFGRIIVSQELGLEANGVFAAASKLAGIVTVVASVITLVWQQLAFERGRGDARFFERGNAVSATVYSLGCTVAVPIGVLVYRVLVDQRYASGWNAVPLFLVVAAMAGYSSFVGNVFYVTERTSSLFWSAAACMVVVVIATVPLVGALGLNGANLALVLGYSVNIGVKHALLKSYDSVGAPLASLVLGAATCIVSVASVLTLTLASAVAVGVVSAIAYAVWSWRSGLGGRLSGGG
jgi:O-antigen/teichoic acid export membrane protein